MLCSCYHFYSNVGDASLIRQLNFRYFALYSSLLTIVQDLSRNTCSMSTCSKGLDKILFEAVLYDVCIHMLHANV